jgi:hypothetical protein
MSSGSSGSHGHRGENGEHGGHAGAIDLILAVQPNDVIDARAVLHPAQAKQVIPPPSPSFIIFLYAIPFIHATFSPKLKPQKEKTVL